MPYANTNTQTERVPTIHLQSSRTYSLYPVRDESGLDILQTKQEPEPSLQKNKKK